MPIKLLKYTINFMAFKKYCPKDMAFKWAGTINISERFTYLSPSYKFLFFFWLPTIETFILCNFLTMKNLKKLLISYVLFLIRRRKSLCLLIALEENKCEEGNLICGEILSRRFKSWLVSISLAFGVDYINISFMGCLSVECKGLKRCCYLQAIQCLTFN